MQAKEKIADIRTIFINFHHILNEYRPHQARESLILMMEEQLEKSKKEAEDIFKMKKKVEDTISGLADINLAEIDEEMNGVVEDKEMQEGLDVWEQLEKEFG
jgi:mediator of RNA polymerase II transcription subunit 7